MSSYSKERRNYGEAGIDIQSLRDNPIDELKLWLDSALAANILDATAFVLSTIDSEGRPDSRVVLLKGIEQNELIFFTCYSSNKGIQLAENNSVALNFHIAQFAQQVRIKGTCAKLARDRSEEYFNSRPANNQLAAIVSPQSREIPDRIFLLDKLKQAESQEISCPKDWGGYKVQPREFEFYKGRNDRLNDRILYRLQNDGWQKVRLAP